MIGSTLTLSLMQAEVVGQSVGNGIVRLILMALIGVGVMAAIVLFLWIVRKVDKKINK